MTNSIEYLSQVDEIIILENGKLIKKGSFLSLDLNEYSKLNNINLNNKTTDKIIGKILFFCLLGKNLKN